MSGAVKGVCIEKGDFTDMTLGKFYDLYPCSHSKNYYSVITDKGYRYFRLKSRSKICPNPDEDYDESDYRDTDV